MHRLRQIHPVCSRSALAWPRDGRVPGTDILCRIGLMAGYRVLSPYTVTHEQLFGLSIRWFRSVHFNFKRKAHIDQP